MGEGGFGEGRWGGALRICSVWFDCWSHVNRRFSIVCTYRFKKLAWLSGSTSQPVAEPDGAAGWKLLKLSMGRRRRRDLGTAGPSESEANQGGASACMRASVCACVCLRECVYECTHLSSRVILACLKLAELDDAASRPTRGVHWLCACAVGTFFLPERRPSNAAVQSRPCQAEARCTLKWRGLSSQRLTASIYRLGALVCVAGPCSSNPRNTDGASAAAPYPSQASFEAEKKSV